MKKLSIYCFLLTYLLVGCSTTLTSEGSRIRSINDSDDLRACEFRGVISAKSPELTLTPAGETEYVMNDARNKVAETGGTHMKILTNQHGLFTGATMSVEAYRCEN